MSNNIGALWKRTNDKGEFFSGVLDNEDGTKQKIVVFKNGYKDKDAKPDYLILKARENISNANSYDISDDGLPF